MNLYSIYLSISISQKFLFVLKLLCVLFLSCQIFYTFRIVVVARWHYCRARRKCTTLKNNIYNNLPSLHGHLDCSPCGQMHREVHRPRQHIRRRVFGDLQHSHGATATARPETNYLSLIFEKETNLLLRYPILQYK